MNLATDWCPAPAATNPQLSYARVLVEIGDLDDAELELVALLDAEPQDGEALSLLAKIKHMHGGLSQAIVCWAQMEARPAVYERSLLHLKSLLHIARKPEYAVRELMTLGGFPPIRNPNAELALEEAFALFLARGPEEACFRCRQMAQRSHAEDRETFKLAVLAESMIYELSGDLENARLVLERLGEERGFETDVDRLFALILIYEQLNRSEDLASAVRLCRFLEDRHPGISALCRLASLYRRLGNEELADEYSSKHDREFRRRMHRPTMSETVRVASERYVPLERLLSIRFPAGAFCFDAGLRERALASVLEGDRFSARAGFLSKNERLDQKYLAELAVLSGDEDLALRLHEELVVSDPRDLQALAWLLEYQAQCPTLGVVALLSNPTIAVSARMMLSDAVRRTPLSGSLWRQLAMLLALEPESDKASRLCHHQADALYLAGMQDARPIGRVLAANVLRLPDRAQGVVHAICASRTSTVDGAGGELSIERIQGDLSAEMRQDILNTFRAVQAYAETKFPHLVDDIRDYDYAYKVTKADEPSEGSSAGLATALAFLSVFLQRAVPQTFAVTGAIEVCAKDVLLTGAVAESETRIEAAYNRNLETILVPVGNRAALRQRAVIPRRVQDEIVHYIGDLDDTVRFVFGHDVLGATNDLTVSSA